MSGSVLVLGGAGFIGRHLCEALAAGGTQVVAATRSVARFDHPGIRNAIASFDDPAQFVPLLADCASVVHAASSSTPGSSAAQPQLDGNLRSTLALLEALQSVPGRSFLYLSSGGTLYGDRDRPARETDPLRPRSYHGAGKAAAEQFIHAWATQYDGAATVLRPSNVYGPGQLPRRGFGIIPAAFDCAVHGTALPVWGDGRMVRDYLYIDDLVALCSSALARPPSAGMQVFNGASGVGTPLHALLDAIDRTTGRPLHREHQPARRVDVHSILLDNRAARDAFGWTPATTLEQGLRTTWQWFTTRQ